MTRHFRIFFAAVLSLAALDAAGASCAGSRGVTLQVLGSGGPIADDARASSAYLLWIDGESRVLVDAGGGAFLRFAEARADFTDLDFLGLSHFHADHSADLPALLKSARFGDREESLRIAGPSGSDKFPALNVFLERMLHAEKGAYGYLSGYLDGSGGLPKLDARVVEKGQEAVTVFESGGGELSVSAMDVPHGVVPAIAFRVEAGNRSVVFASDQNGSDERFADFAQGADILVMHMAIPEQASGEATTLHAKPSRIGEIAAGARPGKLVLSHFMARSLDELETSFAIVRARFDGEVVVAADLDCIALP